MADSTRSDGLREALIDALAAPPPKSCPGCLDALYIVHFTGLSAKGSVAGGVAVLEAGRIFGGDSGYYFTGTYSLDEERLRAEVVIKRHTQNPDWPTAWGDFAAEFDARVEAKRSMEGTSLAGTLLRLDRPDQPLDMTMYRLSDLP
jgi:hypothetical protein